MSEYQYYEFLAIDRPLTAEEISALRALSSRAHITPVSFTNHYEWGDFKGNPDKLMEVFFDAHVYVANWRTAIFKVRVPIEAVPENVVEEMAVPDFLDFKATKTHWIITWSLNESENYDRFGMENGHGWMARLAPVREEILSGDMRCLYIGWLSAVTAEMIDLRHGGGACRLPRLMCPGALLERSGSMQRLLKGYAMSRKNANRRSVKSSDARSARRISRTLPGIFQKCGSPSSSTQNGGRVWPIKMLVVCLLTLQKPILFMKVGGSSSRS